MFASGGFRTPLRTIREVADAAGQPLQRYPLEVEQVADPGPVYLLDRNLVEVMREGTGKGIRRYLPANQLSRNSLVVPVLPATSRSAGR